jgi:hypothetical protein
MLSVMAAGRTTAEDWQESFDHSIRLLHCGRSRCRLSVGKVAMKSADGALALGHQPTVATGSFYGDSSVKPSGWSTLMDCWSRELELDLAGAFNGIKEEV